MRRVIRSIVAVACLVLSPPFVVAEVRPHGLFADHAVLQRDKPLHVWGSADAGESVTVTLDKTSASTVADGHGAWRVELPALPAGGPYVLRFKGTNLVEVRDVMIGEVWVASGQSNMHMPMRPNLPWSAGVLDHANEMAAADYPQIRMFTVEREFAQTPASDVKGSWTVCSPQTIGDYSATAYYFARELHRALKVPVGIVHASVGATGINAWMSREALSTDPKNKLEDFDRRVREYPAALAKYEETKAPGAKLSDPLRPKDPRTDIGSPTLLFNGMIAPLMPYSIRGAIWYQGEANTRWYEGYAGSMARLVDDWRTRWGAGTFPFYFVQLTSHSPVSTEPADGYWPRLREQQALAATQIANVGMAVTIDVGSAQTTHPSDKRSVGERLARIALAKTYGQAIAYSGPTFRSMRVDGNTVRVAFDNADGLKAANQKLTGFAIAGADQRWAWADARVEGGEVVLSESSVSAPVAVRYGWADFPECNLTNASGLPAAPFRTDDWPLTIAAKEGN